MDDPVDARGAPGAEPGRLHPALRALANDGAPLDTPLAELRAASERTGHETAGEPPAGIDERAVRVPVGGAEIDSHVYRPAAAAAQGAPAIVYFHGGGWATGSPAGFAAIARNLARYAGAVVVSVDYRLAPEHRLATIAADCLGAVRWVREQAGALGIEAASIVLAGDSAGAHLALATALALRDAGEPVRAVLAFYPCLDPLCETPSWDDLGCGHYLTRERMRWYWGALLGAQADRPGPTASPWLAPDLSGLAPVWIMTAEFDPLRDEGEAFAHDLREAGVEVGAQRHAGMLHGFLRWRTLVPEAADGAVEAACRWLAAR